MLAPYIVYRAQRVATLLLTIPPEVEFRTVVDSFAEVGYPPLAAKADIVSFALLELVSNSMRAHRERGIGEPVKVSFNAAGSELGISVLDSGRGFDPRLLPYDLDAPVETVDLLSDSFAEYQRRYGGSRFGMGLYVAKKTFPRFSLSFVDRSDRSCPWFSGLVKGTRIDLGLPIVESGAAPPLGARGESADPADEVEELSPLEEVGR